MRRSLLALVLLVAGCGGPVARPYTPKQAVANTTAPAVRAPRTQTITVSRDLRVQVDWPAQTDPLMKVLTGYYVNSWKAVVSGGDAYLKRVEDPAAREAYDWVRGFTEVRRSVKGTARLYALRVAAVMGDGAQINACVDESGLTLVAGDTGEAVAPQPSWTRAPYLQAVVAHRGDDGVWRVKDFRHSAEGCTR
ncbi:MAG: hypothetical protein HOY71_19385 [Nonomuraea sp.]|nr:hypothetical protein [Nonomuraea sp.]